MDSARRSCIEKIERRREKRKRAAKRRRAAAFTTAIAITTASFGWVYTASANEITVTQINEFDGTNETKVIKTHSRDMEKILEKNGVSIEEGDKINIPIDSDITCDTDIVITKSRQITVKTNNGETVINVTKADAREALVEAGYTIDEHDEVIKDGDVIELCDVEIKSETLTEEIPFEKETKEEPQMNEGEKKVITEGKNGSKELIYNVTYRDGMEMTRELAGENIIEAPVNEVTAIGTKKPEVKPVSSSSELGIAPTVAGVLAASSKPGSDTGSTIHGRKYSRKINMSSSAYSAYLTGVGTTFTATGTVPKFGTVAVDPRVIPLGSKLYIEAADGSWVYGFATAEDTGGGIKGNKIDLCFTDPNSQLLVFGRRNCVVYVLE